MISKPNPGYCNIRLALAYILHACGAAGMIATIYRPNDDEAIINQRVDLLFPMMFFSIDSMIASSFSIYMCNWLLQSCWCCSWDGRGMSPKYYNKAAYLTQPISVWYI